MKVAFFSLVLVTLILIASYVAFRIWHVLPAKAAWRVPILWMQVLLFLMLFASFALGSSLPIGLAQAMSHASYTYAVLILYLTMSFVLIDLIRIGHSIVPWTQDHLLGFRRVGFYVTLVGSIAAMVWGVHRFHHPKVVHRQLVLDRPMASSGTLRVVAASDLHLGVTIGKRQLQKFVRLINDQQPDLVLLGGDIFDRLLKPVAEQNMAEDLRRIQAPLGVFAVMGNHEYYSERPSDLVAYLQSANIHVLQDQVALVDSNAYIIGRKDISQRNRSDLSLLVSETTKDWPRILLDHQPMYLEQAAENGIDFQFSGHTHKGQIFPFNLLVDGMFEQAHGYLKKGDTHYYISSGLGIWGPVFRIGTQSELLVLDITFNGSAAASQTPD